ncbi:MAG: TadE/TadG family type IV pilus assembly protein [Parvibaculum sp.]
MCPYWYDEHGISLGASSKEGAPASPCFACDESGSVAIEFAFVAAVFLAILFGIIAYGFQFATRIALSYAVAEGGRAAVAALDDSEREERATGAIYAVLDAYEPLIDRDSVAPPIFLWEDTAIGRAVEITVEYTDSRFSLLPFIPAPEGTMRVTTTYIVADPS